MSDIVFTGDIDNRLDIRRGVLSRDNRQRTGQNAQRIAQRQPNSYVTDIEP
jgi:hypothetical protein